MRRRFARLVLLVVVPVIVATALVTGYAKRPTADAIAFEVYLFLGGDAAELCGDGRAGEHDHCASCVPQTLALAAGNDGPEPDAVPAQPTEFSVAEGRSGSLPVLSAAPRGPPAREDA